MKKTNVFVVAAFLAGTQFSMAADGDLKTLYSCEATYFTETRNFFLSTSNNSKVQLQFTDGTKMQIQTEVIEAGKKVKFSNTLSKTIEEKIEPKTVVEGNTTIHTSKSVTKEVSFSQISGPYDVSKDLTVTEAPKSEYFLPYAINCVKRELILAGADTPDVAKDALAPVLHIAGAEVKVVSVSSRINKWQRTGLQLKANEVALIAVPQENQNGKIVAQQWGVVDPQSRGFNGVEGNGVAAGDKYVAPGKPEGALLVSLADEKGSLIANSIQAFQASGAIQVQGPGEIQFIANDRAGVSILEGMFATGHSYSDNKGQLIVVVGKKAQEQKTQSIQP